MAIPRGLYDLKLNVGYVTVGLSHDTSEFACDCIFRWWQKHGKEHYARASSILLLCDTGGSNNAKHYIFKEHLKKLVDKLGIEIRISHFPPYTSKYNLIEHNLFPHISRACQGVILQDIEMFCDLIRKTRTKNGLRVFVEVEKKIYKTRQQASGDFKKEMPILFDEYLPQWNYTAVPEGKPSSPFYSLVGIRDKIYETEQSLKRTLETLKLDFTESKEESLKD